MRKQREKELWLMMRLDCQTGESPWEDKSTPLVAVDRRMNFRNFNYVEEGDFGCVVKGKNVALGENETGEVELAVRTPVSMLKYFSLGTKGELMAAQHVIAKCTILSLWLPKDAIKTLSEERQVSLNLRMKCDPNEGMTSTLLDIEQRLDFMNVNCGERGTFRTAVQGRAIPLFNSESGEVEFMVTVPESLKKYFVVGTEGELLSGPKRVAKCVSLSVREI